MQANENRMYYSDNKYLRLPPFQETAVALNLNFDLYLNLKKRFTLKLKKR